MIDDIKIPSEIVPLLLAWFKANARILPWRRDNDPYHVWVSEIMLQQTRVEVVRDYYNAFLRAAPTVQDLANLTEDELHKLWEGLGFYRRAKNMHETAKVITREMNGVFPSTYAELIKLSGVGPYTAGAIASISFHEPTPAVDGNVLRVLSRLLESYAVIDENKTKKAFSNALADVYPTSESRDSGNFTQSLMELGATICTPSGNPQCSLCPIAQYCIALKQGTVRDLPVRRGKSPRRREEYTVFLFRFHDRLALEKRASSGLLASLWQLPNVAEKLTPEKAMERALSYGVEPFELVKSLNRKHVFSHIEWDMIGYEILCRNPANKFKWVSEKERIASFALPTAFRKFL